MFFHWFLALPDYKDVLVVYKTKINLRRLQTQISCLLLLQEVESQAINHSFFHRLNVIYKPLWMLRGPEKKFLNNDLFLKNALIWREKKKSWKPGYAQVENLKFLVWKTTPKPASQQVVTQENEQS